MSIKVRNLDLRLIIPPSPHWCNITNWLQHLIWFLHQILVNFCNVWAELQVKRVSKISIMNTGKRFVFFFTASKIRGCWGAISKGGGVKKHTNGSVTWRQAQNKTKIYSWPWFEMLTDKKLCFLSREFTSLLFFTMLQCAITCYHVKQQLLDHFCYMIWIWKRIKMQNVRVFTLLSGPIYTSVRSVWQKYTQSHISCQADTSWWWQVSHTCSLM